MEERFTEIRFCVYINRLLKTLKYSVAVLDIIEAYCLVGDINAVIIKKLMKQVKDNCGYICATKEEIYYMYKQQGHSYRTTMQEIGMSISTQQRLTKLFEEQPNRYADVQPRLNTLEYNEVYKFMLVVDLMKGI